MQLLRSHPAARFRAQTRRPASSSSGVLAPSLCGGLAQQQLQQRRRVATLSTAQGVPEGSADQQQQQPAAVLPPPQQQEQQPAQAAAPPTEPAAAPAGSDAALSLLTQAEPVDRLRYQALLIFEQLDATQAGRLSGEQVASFFTYASRKVSWSPGLSEVLTQVQAAFAGLAAAGASPEEFVRLVRSQVHAVSTSPAYQSSMLRPDDAARLQAQMSVSKQELAAAKWMFGLLDFDNDGKVSLAMYARAQGIEAYVYEDKIEDADADDDGLIIFEEFLGSYAKPKPILKNLVIMALNTAVIYLVLQADFLDVMIKVVLVGALLLKPQIVSRPAALLYDAVRAIVDQGRAQAELAKSNRGVWRPA